MAILDKINNLLNDEIVFLFYNNKRSAEKFIVKRVIKKEQQVLVVFEKEPGIKFGIKIKNSITTYPSFNKKHGFINIDEIITTRDDKLYDNLLEKNNTILQKTQEQKFLITKKNIPKIKITTDNYKADTIKSTIKDKVKKLIKNLISIDNKYRGFLELLKKEDIDLNRVTKNARIFTELLPDKKELLQILEKINLEYRPIFECLKNNNFHLTNISPIVLDSQKLFSRNDEDSLKLIDADRRLNNTYINKTLTDLHSLTTDANNDIGDILLELNLNKNFSKNSGEGDATQSYREFIKKTYGHPAVIMETELNDDFKDQPEPVLLQFDSPKLSHILPNPRKITNLYHSVTLPHTNDIYRYSYKSSDNSATSCVSLNFNEEGNTSLTYENNNIIKRKSIDSINYLEDIYEDSKIGNITTCNGTNKSGDRLYLGADYKSSDLEKSQIKPPKRIPIFEGEQVYVCGFYIHSPNHHKKHIFGGNEIYNLEDNSKEYYPMYSNYKTILDIRENYKKRPIKIIENLDSVSDIFRNYNSDFDYFVIIGKINTFKKTNKLTKEEWLSSIKTITPNLSQILNILEPEFDEVRSIQDIEILLNKYNVSYTDLPNTSSMNIMKKNINTNMKIDSEKLNEHLQTYINFKNQSKLMNNLLKEIVEEGDFNIDEFFEENSIKKTFQKNIKEDLYKFCLEKKPKGDVDMLDFREKVLKKYKSDIFSDFDEENKDILQNMLNKLPKNSIDYKNIGFSKKLLNEIMLITKCRANYRLNSNLKSILELANLYKIKNIIKDEQDKYEVDMELKIAEMEKEIANILDTYNTQKDSEIDFLKRCKGIRIVKKYTSLYKIKKDEGKSVYRDLEYDTLYADLHSLFKSIYRDPPFGLIDSGLLGLSSPTDTLIEQFEDALNNKYIYLDKESISKKSTETLEIYNKLKINSADSNVEKVIELLENYSNQKKSEFYNLTINGEPLRNIVNPGDICLMETKAEKYLFLRSASAWFMLNEEEFLDTPKSFMFDDPSVLNLQINELEALFKKTEASSVDKQSTCIKIDHYSIPKPLFNLISSITEKKKFIKNCKLIISYKNTIDTDISTKISSIEQNFKFIDSSKKLKSLQSMPVYTKSKKSLIPLSIKQKYRAIFTEEDKEVLLKRLLEFTELYGIDYCMDEDCDTEEQSPETAKFWYYNSNKFTMKLCCKHDMEYKNYIYKSNTDKELILDSIKRDYGVAEGEAYICKLCGKQIDTIEDSSFEGFTRDNRLISFREEVKEIVPIELFEEDISIKTELQFYKDNAIYPELLAVRYLISELGIKIKTDDLGYIIGKIKDISLLEVYEKFIKTNIIKECMKKTYLFTKAIKKSKKDKTKPKKKKKKTGGGLENTDLKADVLENIKKTKIFKKLKKNISSDSSDLTELEELFKEELKKEIVKYNNKYSEREISVSDGDLLQNIDDINNLIKFMNADSSSNKVILVLLTNIQKLFNMFFRGVKFLIGIKYLILILQYGLPEYKINPYYRISDNPALRAESDNFLIENLFYNREYIVDNIFRIMETTLMKKQEGQNIRKIVNIFKNIIGLQVIFAITPKEMSSSNRKKTMFLNNLIIFEGADIKEEIASMKKSTLLKKLKTYFRNKILEESEEILIHDEIINTFKVDRVKHEYKRSQEVDKSYYWNEFLPLIETDKISRISIEKILKITKTSQISEFKLNEYLNDLTNNYIFYINKIIGLHINIFDDVFSKYTTSLAFSKITFKFTDYFNIENFDSQKIDFPVIFNGDSDIIQEQKDLFIEYINKLKKIIEHMDLINSKLSHSRIKQKTPIYLFANNNISARNLQEYTNFEILYEGKPLKYYLERLKKLFTTYHIKSEHLDAGNKTPLTSRRIFETVRDPHFEKILSLLKKQAENPTTDTSSQKEDSGKEEEEVTNIVSKYLTLVGDSSNIIIEQIKKYTPDKPRGIIETFFSDENKGEYLVDIITGEFKDLTEYDVEQQHEEYTIDQLKVVIDIIESKIYNLNSTEEESVEFEPSLTFKGAYIEGLSHIENLIKKIKTDRQEKVSNVTDITNIIDDPLISDIVLVYTEFQSITFVTSAGFVKEIIKNSLTTEQKTLFTDVFLENDNKILLFYKEKLDEIKADLKIILADEKIGDEPAVDLENDFYKNKMDTDYKNVLLSIFIYLFKFLITKSLNCYNKYENYIVRNICTEPENNKNFKTSLGREELEVITGIYTDRYTDMCNLMDNSDLNKYLDDFKNTCIKCRNILDLIDNTILSVEMNIVLVKDLILKFLYFVSEVFKNHTEYETLIYKLFFAEVESIFDTYGTREYDIQNYMNVKKTKGNENRKRNFDKKSTEDKISHKLYRRFNLGDMLEVGNIIPEENEIGEEYEEAAYDHEDPNIDNN